MTPTITGMGWKQENYSDRVKLYDISSANGRTDIFYIMGKRCWYWQNSVLVL